MPWTTLSAGVAHAEYGRERRSLNSGREGSHQGVGGISNLALADCSRSLDVFLEIVPTGTVRSPSAPSGASLGVAGRTVAKNCEMTGLLPSSKPPPGFLKRGLGGRP